MSRSSGLVLGGGDVMAVKLNRRAYDHARELIEHKREKARYEFPYGDFDKVHRCGVLTAESRAGQYKHFDVERAAHHLHVMIDAIQ
jgi:hypothetical protein